MTKDQSLFFRFLLFFAGIGIIILAFFLTKGELTRIDGFVWTSIGLMYLIFFLPFFFSAINISNFSRKIPVLSLVWTGILLYITASIIVIVLLSAVKIISVNVAVIIQSILFFLFLIDVYFSYFASSHISSVAAEEAEKKQYINNYIKPKAQVLSLAVNKLPAEYEKAQKTILQTLEEIKYIYPVSDGAGDNLESWIIQSLNTLSELCGNIPSGATPAVLYTEAEKLSSLVKERKLLRN
jgi:hypothetical protein